MRVVALILACAIACLGAAYTSTQSGNWSSTATWGGSGPPGNGDTVTISAGHTVTVDQDTTVGTSPASGNVVLTITTTGQLVVAAGVTFVVRGDVSFTRASGLDPVVTLQPGATWEFDASAAADPMGTHYVYRGTQSFGYGMFYAVCTAASRCVVRSNAAGGNGYFQRAPSGSGVNITAAYVDFLRIGTATLPSIETRYVAGPSGTRYSVTDSTFTDCGMVGGDAAAIYTYTYTHARNVHSGSLNASSVHVQPAAGYSPVVTIEDNVFDGVVGHNTTPQGWDQATIRRNYMGRLRVAGTSASWQEFSGNLVFLNNVSGMVVVGDMSGCYFVQNIETTDPHYLPNNSLRGNTISYSVLEWTGRDTADNEPDGVMGPGVDPASPMTYTLQRHIVVPALTTSGGVQKASATSLTLYGNRTNVLVNMEHNSAWTAASPSANNVISMATGTHATGSVVSYRSNLAVSQPGVARHLYPINPDQVVDVCQTDALCDYNASNAGNTPAQYYVGTWTVPPGPPTGVGTHDVEAEPRLADMTRSLTNFDQGYLGKPTGTTWATATAYAAGDIVSAADSTVYAGRTLNYRCIAAHTSDADKRPGTGTNWRSYWEWASLYWIRQAVAAQTRYTDGAIGCSGCTAIQALIRWVRRGWTPQNLALYLKGHDGATPGAVEMDPPVTRGAWW